MAQRSPGVREPKQERAIATKGRILDATEAVLVAEGLEGCSTRAVAAQAGVNVATLYSYFPDRDALIREVIRRYETERSTEVAARVSLLESPAWRDELAVLLRDMAHARVRRPVGMRLRRIVRGSEELRQLDDESTSRVAQQLARQLRALAPGLTASRSRRVARLVVVVASEGLDDVCRSGSIDALSLRDLTDLLVTYLESVLEGR